MLGRRRRVAHRRRVGLGELVERRPRTGRVHGARTRRGQHQVGHVGHSLRGGPPGRGEVGGHLVGRVLDQVLAVDEHDPQRGCRRDAVAERQRALGRRGVVGDEPYGDHAVEDLLRPRADLTGPDRVRAVRRGDLGRDVPAQREVRPPPLDVHERERRQAAEAVARQHHEPREQAVRRGLPQRTRGRRGRGGPEERDEPRPRDRGPGAGQVLGDAHDVTSLDDASTLGCSADADDRRVRGTVAPCSISSHRWGPS